MKNEERGLTRFARPARSSWRGDGRRQELLTVSPLKGHDEEKAAFIVRKEAVNMQRHQLHPIIKQALLHPYPTETPQHH
ncbi:hypothetical protein DPMN_150431 [Dreissena polymorpha]|uniref:Uncharacterized protein n=1 Tax=Dreissena polymorpha TaxID=45954 RepID=A0A9D4FHP9_DREPO|nr:hypothetical protein DPMN_150431 [Dreissena polymorpha]